MNRRYAVNAALTVTARETVAAQLRLAEITGDEETIGFWRRAAAWSQSDSEHHFNELAEALLREQ